MWDSGGMVTARCLIYSETREQEAKPKNVKNMLFGREMSVNSVKTVCKGVMAIKEIRTTEESLYSQ